MRRDESDDDTPRRWQGRGAGPVGMRASDAVNWRRVQAFVSLAAAVGVSRASRVVAQWREVLAEDPARRADLMRIAFMDAAAVRTVDGRVAPLPGEELIFQAGARMCAQALLDRADLTIEEHTLALDELERGRSLASYDGGGEG